MGDELPKIDLDGIQVTRAGLEELVRTTQQAIRIPGRCRTIVAVNAHTFREGRRSPEYRAALNNAYIVWVAVGAPKQELWAELNRDRLKVPVVACVGAAFEIVAGRFSRAPRWMQGLGLEWSWRMAQDPARLWRRYFSTNGYFLAYLMAQAGRRILGAGPKPSAC